MAKWDRERRQIETSGSICRKTASDAAVLASLGFAPAKPLDLVLDAGYTYSRNRIHRNATTGASLFAVHYSTQEVHPYQDFEATVPVVSVDVDGLTGLGANAVMLALNQIKCELADFEKSIFGEQIETKGQTKEEKQELEKKKKRFEELQAIGYNNLNVKRQDEYNQLAAALYTTEGGRFAEHTGKAPVWIDNRDPSRSRSHNIKVWGSGEIGEIMLDFEWNEMKEKQGWAEVALPMWDKKLWNGSGAPSLRAVADVASNIASAVVAAVPGGAAVAPFVALTDDLLMAGLDYGLGYKDGMDVGKELGRKAAVTAISTYTGAKFAGMGNQVLQTATISSINTTASTAVYSTNFTDFKNSISTYSTWNSTVTSTIGAGVTSALGKIDLRDGNAHNLASNTFDTKNIAAFNSKMGDLTAAALDYKLTGSTTFNVLDVADLGLSVINKRAKEDGSGGFIDSITGEKTTKKIGVHKGILELTIGGDNSGVHLGSGGYNISYGTIASTVAGLTEAAKVADWKYSSLEKSSTLNSINMLSYTTAGDNQTLAKEIWDGTKKVNYTDTGNDLGNYTRGDTINISKNLLGKGNEASAKLATVISHEGTHVYGNRVEGVAHRTGAETYAQINDLFELNADKDFSKAMIAGILNPNSWVENSGDTDHWDFAPDGKGGYGWKEDGDFDFNTANGKITAENMQKMAAAYKMLDNMSMIEQLGLTTGSVNQIKETVISSALATAQAKAENDMLNAFRQSGNINAYFDFITKSGDFADASIIGKSLALENFSKYDINELNNALQLAQESGLLVKNNYKIFSGENTDGLFIYGDGQSGVLTSGYGQRFTEWFSQKHAPYTSQEHLGLDISVNEAKEKPVSILSADDGSIKLQYSMAGGLQIDYGLNANEKLQYMHLSGDTIKNYFNLFGMQETRLNNGILSGIKGSSIIATLGNTGTESTDWHLDLRYKVNNISVNPMNYPGYMNAYSSLSKNPNIGITSGLDRDYINNISNFDLLKMTDYAKSWDGRNSFKGKGFDVGTFYWENFGKNKPNYGGIIR